MRRAFVIGGRLLNPTTVALDEPVEAADRRVEVLVRPSDSETGPELPLPDEFWQERTLEELIAEQGIEAPQRIDSLLGNGADLWDSDEECLAFFADIHASRVRG